MKVIGIREVSGKSKETGRPWAGVKVYFTEPVRSSGIGFSCGSAYFGGDYANVVRNVGGEDFSGLLGCDVDFVYDRWGKPVGINILSSPV